MQAIKLLHLQAKRISGMTSSDQLTVDLLIEWSGRIARDEITIEVARQNIRAAKAPLERKWIEFLDNQIEQVMSKAPPLGYAMAVLNYEAALILDEPSLTVFCAHRLGYVCQTTGRMREAVVAYEHQLDLARQIGDDELIQNALLNLAGIYRMSGNFDRAELFCQEVIDAARKAQNTIREIDALVTLANVLADRGSPHEALQHLERALELTQRNQRVDRLALVLNAMGSCHADLGQFDRALDFHQQALANYRAIKDKQGEGIVLSNMASHHVHLGQYKDAIQLYKQALEIAWRQTDLYTEGLILGNLASVHLLRGEFRQALYLKQKALELARRTGDRAGEAVLLSNLGYLFRLLGNERFALDHYQQALTLAREMNTPGTEAAVLSQLGNLFAAQGQVERAIDCHLQSLEITQMLGDRVGEIADYIHLGNLYHALGNMSEAEHHYKLVLDLAQTVGDQRGRCITLGNLGTLYRDMGLTRAGEERTQLWKQAETALREGAQLASNLGLLDIQWLFLSNLGDYYLTCLTDEDQALAFFLKAVEQLEGMRQELVAPAHRAGFFARGSEIFLSLIQLTLHMGQTGRAIETVERFRSRTMLDLLSIGVMPVSSTLSQQPWRAREAASLARLHEWQLSEGSFLSPDAGQVLRELDELYTTLAHDWPEYFSLRRGQRLSYDELRSCLLLENM